MTDKQLKQLKELRKSFRPHEKAFIMSALPFMTVDEIATTINKSKTKIQTYISILDENHIKQRMKDMFAESRLQKWMEGDMPGFKTSKKKRLGNKRNVIGVRDDLKLFFRSKMEANIARVLNLIYGRDHWCYESEVFELGEIRGKNKKYLTDFHVTDLKGKQFFIEVKGRFWSGDISKMKRFLKKYPEHKVVFVTNRKSKKVIEFCEKNNLEYWFYEDLRDDYSKQIPEWE